VSVDTVLSWRAGREAVSHEVSFGTDPDALALVGTPDTTSYDPGVLDLDTTYYWKIDEVNEADAVSVWEGSIWMFTTQAYLIVDDFESYDDEENRIYDTWLDGFVNETGSTVGHFDAPFAEQGIVNSGSQSMPLFYDNAGVATSEADLELSQDWTASGIQSLSLYFYGDADNTGGQLYVKINDIRVDYDGPTVNITRPSWQTWNIDLTAVGNVRNVNSLTIGIEGAGASGVLYIDDIRLYPMILEDILPDINADLAGRRHFSGSRAHVFGNFGEVVLEELRLVDLERPVPWRENRTRCVNPPHLDVIDERRVAVTGPRTVHAAEELAGVDRPNGDLYVRCARRDKPCDLEPAVPPQPPVRIIGVMTARIQQRVEAILDATNPQHRPVVQVKRS